MGIGSIKENNRVVSKLQTAPPMLADVKLEDVVAEGTSEIGVGLSFAGNNA